jgi:aminopeptidase N
MKFVRGYLCFIFSLICSISYCQLPVDILHYRFKIDLNDSTDIIYGETAIDLKLNKPSDHLYLDLVNKNAKGKGMVVSEVRGEAVQSFAQINNILDIKLKPIKSSITFSLEIFYSGIPADGLIISKNKYGDRTFFSDNWPNRAHNWIPCVDRPDDKASFEFIVTAPSVYKVISNGALMEERQLENGETRTHWKEDVSLPTKVMVIGAARFAVKKFDDSPPAIPVSAWVYPQDSVHGFYDYGVAPSIVKFLSGYIAPFPYNKLANVQSKTIFGGMENASAIFYAEASVTGDRKWEDVIAHEIVHQWFGDMASEKTFADLWLSEGFATYLTNIYIENKYGVEKMRERLKKDRADVIAFITKSNHPVVDTTTDLMYLLNANSYQKGGWILHMLRQETGDSLFKICIQQYYNAYKGGNANTRDFEAVVEEVTGKNLKWFFDQWLYRPGMPQLKIQNEWKENFLEVDIKQLNPVLYTHLPLEVRTQMENGKTLLQKIVINDREQKVKLKLPSKPITILFDPEVSLLFEQK